MHSVVFCTFLQEKGHVVRDRIGLMPVLYMGATRSLFEHHSSSRHCNISICKISPAFKLIFLSFLLPSALALTQTLSADSAAVAAQHPDRRWKRNYPVYF